MSQVSAQTGTIPNVPTSGAQSEKSLSQLLDKFKPGGHPQIQWLGFFSLLFLISIFTSISKSLLAQKTINSAILSKLGISCSTKSHIDDESNDDCTKKLKEARDVLKQNNYPHQFIVFVLGCVLCWTVKNYFVQIKEILLKLS